MKKIIPFILLVLFALLSILALLPGCDELVTRENYYYDTVTIYDSSCVAACHSDVNDEMIIAQRQWAKSGHASGSLLDTMVGGQHSSTCGPECHTRQGFVQSLSEDPDTVVYSLEISCFACHAPHSGWDFDLRTTSQVTLANGETYNRGISNICARCHQAATRIAEEIPDPFTSVNVTIYWGPHGSQQADMLEGTGGYEYAGGLYINSTHGNSNNANCFKCHQAISVGYTLGGHSMNVSYHGEENVASCNLNGCHTTDNALIEDFSSYANNDNLQNYQDSITILYDTLVSRGLLPLVEADTITISDAGEAGAVYNYRFLTREKSNGNHNTSYALSLLRESLNYLNSR
jgi:hypothetical protein